MFRHDGPASFEPQPPDTLAEEALWLAPPWKARSDETSFEFSWDVAQAFFEELSNKKGYEWVRPLYHLVAELRDAGLDAQLRAGQSLSSLGLSRSRGHGLRPEQDSLFLSPQADGSIVVEGTIRGEAVRVGPIEAKLVGSLRSLVDELCSVAID